VFDTLSGRLDKVFTSLRGKGRLSDKDIDATAREIRVALLEADVALPVVRAFVTAIKERARGEEVSRALNPAQQVVKIVQEELTGILGGGTATIHYAKTPPTVIMLAGLQGSGKTTLAGKLGLWLKRQGHAPLLVACDLQRPNAVQQLQVVGAQAGVDVFAPEPGSGVGDPVRVARDSIEHARRFVHDIVVVDTAGRLGVDEELMQQAADIRAAVQPDEVLFVVDAMIGQDAVNTALAFQEGVGFTGVVLTKLDGDARGGAALSVRHVTGQPIMFASTGEKLPDFDVFHPERMAARILDMGDLLTMIEQAERTFERDEAEAMAAKLATSDFTFEDFLDQLAAVKRMGPIKNLLGMLPGAGQMKEQLDQVEDRDIDRLVGIIHSMTPAERADPKIFNASRRGRVAAGAGVTVQKVNELLERFDEARKQMKMVAGMTGLGGARKARQVQKKGKGAVRKGNPAARAAAAQAAADKRADAPPNPFGLPRGMGEDGDDADALPDLSQLKLPPGGFPGLGGALGGGGAAGPAGPPARRRGR